MLKLLPVVVMFLAFPTLASAASRQDANWPLRGGAPQRSIT